MINNVSLLPWNLCGSIVFQIYRIFIRYLEHCARDLRGQLLILEEQANRNCFIALHLLSVYRTTLEPVELKSPKIRGQIWKECSNTALVWRIARYFSAYFFLRGQNTFSTNIAKPTAR